MDIKCICGICPTGCRVIADLEDGKIVKVRADNESIYGNICPIGAKAPEIIYSSKRVVKPLIRNGEKGKAKFREGTWDEALDIIEKNLKDVKEKYGAHAISSYMGRGTLEDSLYVYGDAPFKDFGSPNDMDCGSICNIASNLIAPAATLGMAGMNMVEDYENADTIVVWGINPFKNNPPVAYKKIKKGKKNGAFVISVDPRKNQTADLADLWIPIRPGTDGALALGIINLLIKKSWYDAEFVKNWCTGFQELKEHVKDFNIKKVSKICDIEQEQILLLASKLRFPGRSVITFYTGLEYAKSGIQNIRVIYILLAITGNIDVKGGLYIDTFPMDNIEETKLPDGPSPIGAEEYPLFYAMAGRGQFIEFTKAVLQNEPYTMKALILIGGSPIISYPGTDLWIKAYNKLKFLAVVDRFMPEEARWADVILPAATYYETKSFQYYPDRISIREKVIEPVGEAMGDVYILGEIAERLGYGHKFPRNEEELIENAFKDKPDILNQLKSSGEVFYGKSELIYKKYETGKLRCDGGKGFPTPSGKIEIKSELLSKYGYGSLPEYEDPYDYKFENGTFNKEFPLVLTTGSRGLVRQNSQYMEIPELTKYDKEPLLEINKEDADIRGISSGDDVILITEYGQVFFKAKVTDRIGKGIVHVPHGGGKFTQNESWKNANINSALSFKIRDEISGYIVLKSLCCQVSKSDK